MSFRYNNKPIDVTELTALAYPTPMPSLMNCMKLGREAARNHYFGEDTTDLPYGIKSWNVYPYQIQRPAAYHFWSAGFCEEWSALIETHGEFVDLSKASGDE